jgi:heme/copper-type cytochrome/quinol oxidase subunit 3
VPPDDPAASSTRTRSCSPRRASRCSSPRAPSGRGRRELARNALVAAGALSIAFLAGQVFAWQEIGPSLYFIQGSPAIAFFYVLTTVHGLHLLGGLYVLGRAATRFAGGAELIDLRQTFLALRDLLAFPAARLARRVRRAAVPVRGRPPMAHDAQAAALSPLQQVSGDFASDKQAFSVPWGKAMMWIFLLSDTFIFSCFLTSYMNVRFSTLKGWPNPSEVFSLHIGGRTSR